MARWGGMMRRFLAHVAFALAIPTAALALSGCERDRPVPPRPQLSDADRQTVREEMAAIRAKADQADKERRAVVDKAPPPSDDPAAAKCPVTVHQLLGEFDDTDLVMHRTGIHNKAHDLTKRTEPPKWWHGEGRARGFVDSGLGLVEISLKPDYGSGETVEHLLAQVRNVKLPEYVVTIVPEEAVKPVLLGADSFQGGLLRGRAYLWSEREKRLLCGATVRAESSDSVKTFSGGDAGLFMDLIATACIQAAFRFTVLPAVPPPVSATVGPAPPRGKAMPKK